MKWILNGSISYSTPVQQSRKEPIVRLLSSLPNDCTLGSVLENNGAFMELKTGNELVESPEGLVRLTGTTTTFMSFAKSDSQHARRRQKSTR